MKEVDIPPLQDRQLGHSITPGITDTVARWPLDPYALQSLDFAPLRHSAFGGTGRLYVTMQTTEIPVRVNVWAVIEQDDKYRLIVVAPENARNFKFVACPKTPRRLSDTTGIGLLSLARPSSGELEFKPWDLRDRRAQLVRSIKRPHLRCWRLVHLDYQSGRIGFLGDGGSGPTVIFFDMGPRS